MTIEKAKLVDDVSASEVIGALQQVASDNDADTVERLAIKAGLWWKCACGWVNTHRENLCGGCQGMRDQT